MPPPLPSEAEIRTVVASLSRDQQAQVLKRLLVQKINESDCWQAFDLKALRRIIKIVFRPH